MNAACNNLNRSYAGLKAGALWLAVICAGLGPAMAQTDAPDGQVLRGAPGGAGASGGEARGGETSEGGAENTGSADARALDADFAQLADPDNTDWERAESDIRRAWSRSGSASMDLLLKRGEQALDGADAKAATEHLTALTDHAPNFAEGWAARANAYLAQGLYGPAVSDLGHALTLEPRHWGALATLGGILEEIDDAPRALSAYRASFALNPHQPDVKDAITRLEKQLAGTAL